MTSHWSPSMTTTLTMTLNRTWYGLIYDQDDFVSEREGFGESPPSVMIFPKLEGGVRCLQAKESGDS